MTRPRRDVIELVPKELIFTKGVGKHKEKLTRREEEMKQRKAEWDALSETEKAALISERRRYCESLPYGK